MAKQNGKSPRKALKSDADLPPPVTPLARTLLRLRAKHLASGGKFLNRRELEKEIAEIRGVR